MMVLQYLAYGSCCKIMLGSSVSTHSIVRT